MKLPPPLIPKKVTQGQQRAPASRINLKTFYASIGDVSGKMADFYFCKKAQDKGLDLFRKLSDKDTRNISMGIMKLRSLEAELKTNDALKRCSKLSGFATQPGEYPDWYNPNNNFDLPESHEFPALRAVANQAVRRKTGARGLRAILEQAMLDIMYEIPSRPNIQEVVISEEVITRKEPPFIVYHEQKEAS